MMDKIIKEIEEDNRIDLAHNESSGFADWLSMLDKRDLLEYLDIKTRDDLIDFIGFDYLKDKYKEESFNIQHETDR